MADSKEMDTSSKETAKPSKMSIEEIISTLRGWDKKDIEGQFIPLYKKVIVAKMAELSNEVNQIRANIQKMAGVSIEQVQDAITDLYEMRVDLKSRGERVKRPRDNPMRVLDYSLTTRAKGYIRKELIITLQKHLGLKWMDEGVCYLTRVDGRLWMFLVSDETDKRMVECYYSIDTPHRRIDVGTSDFVVQLDRAFRNVRYLAGEYNLTVYEEGLLRFSHWEKPVDYCIALTQVDNPSLIQRIRGRIEDDNREKAQDAGIKLRSQTFDELEAWVD